MTQSQRIALRLSEVRQRLNEISGLEGDAFTDEIRSESERLQNEFRDLETRYRAALVAEGDEEQRTRSQFDEGDAEARELQRLTDAASLGAIFSCALEHRQTDGETAELQQHLGLGSNQIPLALLRIEERAATPAPTNVGQTQQAIIPGVFPRAAGSWLSVDMPTVGVGDATFPVLKTNADPGTPAKGASQAETTGAFSAEVLTPGRIQASFFYNREDRARFAGMDEALRSNLSDALSDKLDQQIISGANGLLTGTNLDDNDASGVTSYADYKSLVYGSIDGKFANGAGDIRVLVGPESLAHMANVYLQNTDTQSALDQLSRVSGGVRVSAHVPGAASSKQECVIRRGMRRDMVAPVWEGVTIIPDEVTKADSGQIVITAVMLYAVKILRADGFKKVELQFKA